MADVKPLRALHYNLERTGGLQDVVAPPYDVIDEDQRADLEAARRTTWCGSTCQSASILTTTRRDYSTHGARRT